MTGLFRQKSAASVAILLVYAVVLKCKLFLSPSGPLFQSADGLLYKEAFGWMEARHLPNIVYSCTAFLLFFIQAMLINRIASLQKMFTKAQYLPAMAYILVTSLWPAWNVFSSTLLVNTVLIWAFYQMLLLYDAENILSAIYNCGLVIGLSALLYQPALVILLLLFFSLFILRPFSLREWVMVLLGAATPYYFIGIFIFLTDRWSLTTWTYSFHLGLPIQAMGIKETLSLFFIALLFMIGGFYMQGVLNKVLIQVRKNWSLVLLYLMITASTIFFVQAPGFQSWLLCCVPITFFHAAAYFYPERRVVASLLQWLLFSYALFMNFRP